MPHTIFNASSNILFHIWPYAHFNQIMTWQYYKMIHTFLINRVPVPLQAKLTPPPPPPSIQSPQRPLPKVDSFWSVTIREHDISYRWKEEMEEEERLSAYKEARRLRYLKALQAQKEELGIGENRRKYLYAPVS